MGQVHVRRLQEEDSFEEITDLLHRAYSVLADLGLRYLATHQDSGVTKDRCLSGETYVGVFEGRIVSTVTLKAPGEADSGYYGKPGVASFGQFGVDLPFQRSGLGAGIMRLIEERAREMGALELACDTAQPAKHLIQWYDSMGYRKVEEADWRPTTNYKSWILAKVLHLPTDR